MIGLSFNTRVANPNDFRKLSENVYYSVFSFATNELDELIDSEHYFTKCACILKPFDRIQIIKEDDRVVYEYLVINVSLEANKVVIQKLSKIELDTGKQFLFGYDISTKQMDDKLISLDKMIKEKLATLDQQIDEKIQNIMSNYLGEDEEE